MIEIMWLLLRYRVAGGPSRLGADEILRPERAYQAELHRHDNDRRDEWNSGTYAFTILLRHTLQTFESTYGSSQAVDFHTLGHDFFPAGSAQRLWLDAYAKGVDRFSENDLGRSLALVITTPVVY